MLGRDAAAHARRWRRAGVAHARGRRSRRRRRTRAQRARGARRRPRCPSREALAERLAAGAPRAQAAAREAVHPGRDLTMADGHRLESDLNLLLSTTATAPKASPRSSRSERRSSRADERRHAAASRASPSPRGAPRGELCDALGLPAAPARRRPRVAVGPAGRRRCCCAPPTAGCTRARPRPGPTSTTWSRLARARDLSQLVGRGRRRRGGCVDAPGRGGAPCARGGTAGALARRRRRDLDGAQVVVLGTTWAAPLTGLALAEPRRARRAGRAPGPARSVSVAGRADARVGGGRARPRRPDGRAPRSQACWTRAAPPRRWHPPRVLANVGLDDPPLAGRAARRVRRTRIGRDTGSAPRRAVVGRRATTRRGSAARRSPIRSRACWRAASPSTSCTPVATGRATRVSLEGAVGHLLERERTQWLTTGCTSARVGESPRSCSTTRRSTSTTSPPVTRSARCSPRVIADPGVRVVRVHRRRRALLGRCRPQRVRHRAVAVSPCATRGGVATSGACCARSTVPMVASMQGNAVGFGFELALQCDLRIAADDCVVALPEARVGMIPAGGASQTLHACRGHRAPALADGPDRRADPGAADALRPRFRRRGGAPRRRCARARTRSPTQLAARPTAAVRAAKASVWAALDLPLDVGLRREADLAAPCSPAGAARAPRRSLRGMPPHQGLVGPFPAGHDPEEYDKLRRRVLWKMPSGLYVLGCTRRGSAATA